jgi:hypothetical protein
MTKVNVTEDDLKPMSIWVNVGLSTFYIVLGVATLQSTNGPGEHQTRSVVYWSLAQPGLRYREVSEFLDGRFRPVVKPLEKVC